MVGSSAPAGNTTTTTNNVPFNSAALNSIDSAAQNLYTNNPLNYYPGQTLASQSSGPTLGALGNNSIRTGQMLANSNLPYTVQNSALRQDAAAAGGTSAPVSALNLLAGSNPASSQISGLSGLAGSNPANYGGSLNDLSKFASGSMVGSNPYLNSMFASAAAPVKDTFMSATAPMTDSSFERANRFGSGTNISEQGVNENALGRTLSNLQSSIYGPAYAQDMANMLNAGGTLGQLGVSGMNAQTNALSNAGNLGVTGQNSQISAANNAATAEQAASNSAAAISQLPWTDLSTGINAQNQQTAQQQAQLTDAANRFYGQEYAPWAGLNQEASIVGGAIPGLSSTSSPYFNNPAGSAIGTGISGIGALGSLGSGIAALK